MLYRTSTRWVRRGFVTGALVVAMLAMALPHHAAHAAPPIRERSPRESGSFVFPAGEACSFPVGVEIRFVFGSITEFSDGRIVFTDHADFTLTNLDTGATFVQHTNATFTDTPTADGNIFEVLDGSFFFGFLPGDQGPDGVVGEGGASYILVGHFEYTFDPDTFQIISFQGSGRATDLCQLLGQ
jgi:hypothetical protein